MLLIKFFGLRRSGNHAILNWLLGLEKNTLFLNQIRPYANPIQTHSPVSIPEDVRSPKIRKNGMVETTNLQLFDNAEKNGNIICSYEHINLNSLDMDKLNSSIFSVFGKYENNKNIFVLRNIFNVIPGLILLNQKLKNKILDEEEKKSIVRTVISFWKSYAYLVLAPTTITRGEFVPIIYEKWLMEKSYRDEIAKLIGYENHDINIDFVSDAGGGSSWSGTKKNIDKNKLLDRWSSFPSEDKQIVMNIIKNNRDVLELVEKIFGVSSIPKDFDILLIN